jgi:cytochrome c556
MAQHQKQNMRDHLLVVQEVTTALSSGDFDSAERAARRIASSASMTQTCEHMGSHAPGFAERALGFHRTADTLVEATRKRDRDAVLAALGQTLDACTGCHATYKQQIVDETTWAALSTAESSTRPPH